MKRLWVAVTAAAVLGAAGCGETVIDGGKIEDAIRKDVEEAGLAERVKTIECPDDEPSKTGHRFNCTVTRTDGGKEPIPVEVTDGEKGNVNFGTEAQ